MTKSQLERQRTILKARIVQEIHRMHLSKAERKGKTPQELFLLRIGKFQQKYPGILIDQNPGK